ncbi:ABC transporter permease [Planomonospora sp. ID91781]|uniref:FtsX-like permease family protein n=1 Tax=Planomonospora sp. ID91781 TaxID=2738135 RepID=UPI001E3A580B|nr:ABC transporter permease [Planomonospora sp. ID91781]
MRAALGLGWRLLRAGGRKGLLGAALTAVAVTVSTALLLFAVSANLAFEGRGDREAWRNPVPAQGRAVAVQSVRVDYVRDERITVVELAALEPGAPPPPGLDRFPAPGEVWLSPALAELARRLPADQLAGRFAGGRGGTVGDEALVHPGELVAVRGWAPDSPVLAGKGTDEPRGEVAPTRISDFTGEPTPDAQGYRILALIASVLMAVPLLVFGGAAARLTVARRDQRLAALRLVGATPGQVVAMTAAEAVITAFAGAVAGTLLYVLLIPPLTGIEIAGGSWFAADLWPGVPYTLAVLAAVPLLVGLSAVVGLRRVVVGPLGVAKRETPPGMRFVRVAVLLAVLAVVPTLSVGSGGGMIAVVLGLAFLSINLAGPWVVGLIGRITAGTARGPARLLAGRRLVDDPRAAWRTVSGVALTGFVAGFVVLLNPSADLLGEADASRLRLSVPAARADAVAAEARERLTAAGVRAGTGITGEGGEKVLVVALGGGRAAAPGKSGKGGKADTPVDVRVDAALVDRARTALDGLVPGRRATSTADDDRFGHVLIGDIGTGTIVVLTVSFMVAVVSAGITAVSSVLDRRQTYALLRLAGTPLQVLDRARRAETLIPLAVMGGGSIAVGLFCALPFAITGLDAGGLATLLACVLLGFAGVVGAGAASAPVLRSVTENPAPRPD